MQRKVVWIGIILTLLGSVSYWFLLDVPWIRSTALPNLLLVAAGMILSTAGLRRRRTRGSIAAVVVADLLGAAFVFSLFVLMRLPAPGAAAVADRLPDFTLPNQDARPVTLSSFRGKGPVLLVFYRGHW